MPSRGDRSRARERMMTMTTTVRGGGMRPVDDDASCAGSEYCRARSVGGASVEGDRSIDRAVGERDDAGDVGG
jgi:hypothetical protein